MSAHRSRACGTSSSRHLRFLATQHPSPFGLDLAGGRVQEWYHTVLSKNGSPSASVNINPPVHVPEVTLCAGAGNGWLPRHDGAEGTVKLGMCYLNLTGCHLYLYPATMSIMTVISLTVSITNALAPVLKLQSRTGISVTLKARLHHKTKV